MYHTFSYPIIQQVTPPPKKHTVDERIAYLNDQGLLDKQALLEEQLHKAFVDPKLVLVLSLFLFLLYWWQQHHHYRHFCEEEKEGTVSTTSTTPST